MAASSHLCAERDIVLHLRAKSGGEFCSSHEDIDGYMEPRSCLINMVSNVSPAVRQNCHCTQQRCEIGLKTYGSDATIYQ